MNPVRRGPLLLLYLLGRDDLTASMRHRHLNKEGPFKQLIGHVAMVVVKGRRILPMYQYHRHGESNLKHRDSKQTGKNQEPL